MTELPNARPIVADPSRTGFRLAPARLVVLGAAMASALLTYLGVQLMHRDDSFTLLPSLPSGILADIFPNPLWVLLGTLCALLGCLLAFFLLPAYGVAAGTQGQTRAKAGDLPTPSVLSRTALSGGIVATVVALALYAYVLSQAPGHQSGNGVLAGLILAVVLCGLAIRLLASGPNSARRHDLLGRLTPLDGALIVLAIVGYVMLNAHDFRDWLFAYAGDEWAFYNLAENIAHGSAFDMLSQAGVYGIHPYANSAYQALVMHIFGVNINGWRLSCTLSVALPIAALYWLGKQIGGTALAASAAVFYASCHLLWAFSHIGYNNNDPLLVAIPSAALLYAGMRAERNTLLFAAGACAGAAWYSLFTGRLMIGVLCLVLVTDWQGGWRTVGRRLLFVLGGFVLVALPLVLDNGADTIRQMFPLISISQARTSAPVAGLLRENTARGLYAFLYATEFSHYVLGEVFDAISATALCLGVALALREVRDLAVRLVLIWFVVGLLLTTPLYYVAQIADTRLMFAVPPAALLAGLGLCSVARGLVALLAARVAIPLFHGLLALALVWAFALNHDRFYNAMPRALQVNGPALTIGALTAYPERTAVLVGNTSDNNLCQVLDGFQVDYGRVPRFANGQLLPQCTGATPGVVHPAAVAMVLVADQDLPRLSGCPAPTRILQAPNRQQSLWAYTLTIAPDPSATYATRLAARVLGLCTALGTLPQP